MDWIYMDIIVIFMEYAERISSNELIENVQFLTYLSISIFSVLLRNSYG